MGVLEITILAGALAGGFISGLLGFGTGLAALAIWLTAVEPIVAAPLVVICSVISQAQTLPKIGNEIVWPRTLPFILGGLIGVPAGTLLLPHASVDGFKIFFGCFLMIYCSFMLFRNAIPTIEWGGRAADAIVGVGGGVLGGLAGLSGPLPTIWASLRGWRKDQKRGVVQMFNLSILTFALITQAIGGFMTLEVGRLTLVAFPATVLGAWAGRRLYDKVDDLRFNQIVLSILLLSGLSLVVTTAFVS